MNSITNFLEIYPWLGTAGQPEPDDFARIRAAGYEVLINLVPPSSGEALPDEEELATETGMEYIHIPVIWQVPTRQDYSRFVEALRRHRGRKVFVHCVLNMRVSAFVFLYRVLEEGVAVEEARQAMLKIWQPNPVWQHFVDGILIEASQNGSIKDGAI